MMSIDAAINNEIFLTYLMIVGGLLATAGVLLTIMSLVGKNLSSNRLF